jgi:hypothetical protein
LELIFLVVCERQAQIWMTDRSWFVHRDFNTACAHDFCHLLLDTGDVDKWAQTGAEILRPYYDKAFSLTQWTTPNKNIGVMILVGEDFFGNHQLRQGVHFARPGHLCSHLEGRI